VKVVNGEIVEATDNELFSYWLSRGWCDVYSFPDFKARMELLGTNITPDEVHNDAKET
jgi:hypothetical protein